MFRLRVVEGRNKFGSAKVAKDGIRYRGRSFTPSHMRRLDSGSIEAGNAAIGAVAGGAVLGGAGALVGAALGGRGRTAVVIAMTDGTEIVATVPSAEYAELYVEIEKLKGAGATGKSSNAVQPASHIIVQLLLGPFYLVRFGGGWLIVGLLVTVLTYGLGWIGMPLIADILQEKREARAHQKNERQTL